MILDTRQKKTVIPERWETNEVSPMMDPAYSLREYLGHGTGRENIG